MGTDEEAKWILGLLAFIEECSGSVDDFWVGIFFLTHIAEFFEGIAIVRTDMGFPQQSYAIAKRFEVMDDALGSGN